METSPAVAGEASMDPLRTVALLSLCLVASSVAHAANHNHLGAGPGATGFFVTPTPQLVPEGRFSLSTATWLGSGPLSCRGITASAIAVPVSAIGGLALHTAWGVTDYFELSFGLPALVQGVKRGPDTPICTSEKLVDRPVFGVNDPIARARVVPFPQSSDSIFALALEGEARLPAMRAFGFLASPTLLGHLYPDEVTELFGDDVGAFQLSVNPGARWRFIEVAGELGISLRPKSPLLGQDFGSELIVGAGARLHALYPGLYVVGDVFSRLSGPLPVLSNLSSSTWNAPTEAIVGLRFDWHPAILKAGIGGSVLPGYGTPALRMVVSATFAGFGELPLPSPPLFDLSGLWPKLLGWLSGGEGEGGNDGRRQSGAGAKGFRCPEPGEERELFYDPRCPLSEPEGSLRDEPSVDEDIDGLEAALCPAPPPSISRQERDIVYVIRLGFGFDEADLDDEERARLNRELAELPANAELVEINIRGHADGSGPSLYNLELSERRALHIAEVLEEAGLPAELMRVIAVGEDDPLIDEAPEPDEGTAANRRVRVVLRYRLPPEEEISK